MSTNADAKPSDPIAVIVRLLGKVRRELKRTAKDAGDGHIHDLRVAIRRARQGLSVFGAALPKQTVKKARKKLGRILDAAGPVRDIDVTRQLMKKLGVRPAKSLSRALGKERTRRKQKLQKTVVKFAGRDPAKHWLSDIGDESAGESLPGFEVLPALATAYFEKGDRTADRSTPVEDLHRFRLRTKKLRYTLELYRGLLGEGLGTKLSKLRTIQDHLGSISDCLTALEVLDDLRSTDEADVNRVMEAIRPQIEKEALAFRRQWRHSFNSSEQRSLIGFLRQEAWTSVPRRPASKSEQTPAKASRTG